MSSQLFPEQTSEIVQRINPAVKLHVDKVDAVKVAPSLRQRSRDLRATSESLRLRNLEVMKRATEVAARYDELCFGDL